MSSTARRHILTDRPRTARQRALHHAAHRVASVREEPPRRRGFESGVMPIAREASPLDPHGVTAAELGHLQLARLAAADDPAGETNDAPTAQVAVAAAVPVTLCVFGWHNVQPGVLSWVFASLEAALRAVQAMRNAIQWIVVRGSLAQVDLDHTRRHGDVLAAST